MSFSLDDMKKQTPAQPAVPAQQPDPAVNPALAGTTPPAQHQPQGIVHGQGAPLQPPANPGVAPGIPLQSNVETPAPATPAAPPPAAAPSAPVQQGDPGAQEPTLEEIQAQVVEQGIAKYNEQIARQFSPEWAANWMPQWRDWLKNPDGERALAQMLDSGDQAQAQQAEATLEQINTDAANLMQLLGAISVETDGAGVIPLEKHIDEYCVRPQKVNYDMALEIRRKVMEPLKQLKSTAEDLVLWVTNFRTKRAEAARRKEVEAQRKEAEELEKRAEEQRKQSLLVNNPQTAEDLKIRAQETEMEAKAADATATATATAPLPPPPKATSSTGQQATVRNIGVAAVTEPRAFLEALLANAELFDLVIAENLIEFKATKIRGLMKKRKIKDFPGLGSKRKQSAKLA